MEIHDLWELADCIECELEVRGGTIYGEVRRSVHIGVLQLPVTLEVQSSAIFGRGAAVLCRTVGNVLLLVLSRHPKGSLSSVYVLDLAKLKGQPEGFFEKRSPRTADDALDLVKGAIVREFVKNSSRKWVER